MINALIQTAYPQALAKLIHSTRDIHYAEEFLQMAVEQALIDWPDEQPNNPVAWLVRVAQNRFIDFYRRQKKQISLESLAEVEVQPDLSEQALLLSYNDDLLRLIFTCCHPSLNQQTQIILALKHVLGLNVSQIANALLLNKKTAEQRLTRAKQKISANNIQYQIPAKENWPERLDGVLKTIYLLFNEGYFATDDMQLIRQDLCKEAIRLARLLQSCIKGDPEVIGLLALLLQSDARSPARVDNSNQMVLLADQNRTLWKKTAIQEGNSLVEKALRLGKGTPYAIQAAIASVHNSATDEADTDWRQIYLLYTQLLQRDNNPVIQLNAAIALAKSGEFDRAIDKILSLEAQLASYRHYHTSLAGLYFEQQSWVVARQYYLLAISKAQGKREKTFILQRISECELHIRG